MVTIRSADKAQPLTDDGIEAPSAPEAVAGAELVITMLADGDAVAEVRGVWTIPVPWAPEWAKAPRPRSE